MVSSMRKALVTVLASLGLLTAGLGIASAANLITYQATGWRYKQVPHGDPLTSTFMNPLFDDSAWPTGQAAFGSGGGCALQATVHTSWSVNTDMLMRHGFYANPSAPVTVYLAIDNNAKIWVNGTQVLNVTDGGCPSIDNHIAVVPVGVITAGLNVVAVQAIDVGVESFVDVRVEGTPNLAPDCSGAVASDAVLWPPNHKYRAISVQGVTDPDGDPVAITITGVTQDEPINTRGDGNTCPDAQISGSQASVRAERTGTPSIPGNGRVYRISFTADDGRGGTCQGSVSVCVPHDQDDPTCVDDGQQFDSMGSCAGGPLALENVSSFNLSVGAITAASVALEYSLPAPGRALVSVFDVAGRRVATLENGDLSAGVHQRTWNVAGVANGVYFVRLQSGGASLTRTILKAR